ncbi:MAG TPA: hypothetical protein VGI72_13195 [Gaiellales bacterium]
MSNAGQGSPVGPTFEAPAALIQEELSVQIAMQRQIDTPEGCRVIAELIADVVVDRFEVRQRPDLHAQEDV